LDNFDNNNLDENNERTEPQTTSDEPADNAPLPEKEEELNRYLFEYKANGSDGAPLNEKNEKRSRRALKYAIGGILATIVLFFGAFYGVYFTLNTSVFKDSEFFAAFVAKWSGVTENRVEVEYISGEYRGDNIELSSAVLNNTVLVRTVQKNETTGTLEPLSQGSGAIYSYNAENGYTLVVTNHHVIENGGDILIETFAGDRYYGKVKATDAVTDLALIEFTADKPLTAAKQADSDNLKFGQNAVVAGNPLGHGFAVSFGYIAHPKCSTGEASDPLIQLDISVNPGNSGGGVFDSQGNLIGIICSKASGENIDGIGYAIPINTVNDVIDDLLAYGYVQGRPALGITVVDIRNEAAYRECMENDLNGYLDANVRLGVFIIESKNSMLKKGDRIVSINGKNVIANESVSDAIKKLSPGTAVDIKVERFVDGQLKTLDLKVVLGTRDWAD